MSRIADETTRQTAKRIGNYQTSGSAARNLMVPQTAVPNASIVPSSSTTVVTTSTTSTTATRRNHQKDHRKALKEMQLRSRSRSDEQKEKAKREAERSVLMKRKKFGKVRSKVYDTASTPTRSPSSCSRSLCDSSSNGRDSNEENKSTRDKQAPLSTVKIKKKIGPSSEPARRFDFSRANIGRIDRREPSSSSPLNGKHRSYGKVPSYIKERKARLLHEKDETVDAVTENDATLEHDLTTMTVGGGGGVDGGMVRIPESERVETLSLLKRNEAKIRGELYRLPLATTTEGTIQKRERLEAKVSEIEEAIKLFSKEKVFVFRDQEGNE